MKKKTILLILGVSAILLLVSCGSYDLPYVEGLEQTKIDGVICYDYRKYHDEQALSDISLSNITEYQLSNKFSALAGYEWYYINEEGFRVFIEYYKDDPKKIKNAYFENDEKLPLIKDGTRYMNVYQYIKLHNYIYDYDITNKNCIEYKRIRDFSDVSQSSLIKYGLSLDKVSKLITFSNFIPLSDISSMDCVNNNYDKFKISFKNSESLFSNISSGIKYYYLTFNQNGTIDFYANYAEIIVDDDVINESHYYMEQVNFKYINETFIKILEEYICEDINVSKFSCSYMFNKGKDYVTFKRKYSEGDFNQVETYMNILFNFDDTIKVLDVFYGENNIYHED